MSSSSTTPTKTPIPRAPRKRSRVRCGECEACKRDDCGVCSKCLKKKKFGGDGSCKEPCVNRKCNNLKERPPPKKARSKQQQSDDDELDDYILREDAQMQEYDNDAPPSPVVVVRRSGASSNKKSVLETSIAEPTTSSSSKPAGAAVSKPLSIDKPVYKPVPVKSSGGRKSPASGRKSPAASKSSTKKSRKNKRRASDPKGKPYLYGRSAPGLGVGKCAGCMGKRTDELMGEPILLCDGCDREFHLECCMPPLEEVPTESYFCLDCSPKGSAAALEAYFEAHHEERANYSSSYEFVQASLSERLQDEMEQDEEEEPGSIPMSELNRVSKMHRDALTFSSRYIALKNPSPQAAKVMKKTIATPNAKVAPVSPYFFVGKCVRLYCLNDNIYHAGRIVDVRPATQSTKFWDSEVGHYEYLVRFLAGKDYRKTSYHQWMVLEEHSLAVASTLVWGMRIQRKGVLGWSPGQTWLRTSLELVPVRRLLVERTNQMYTVGGEPMKPDHKSWSLVAYNGGEHHELVELGTEAVDFFSLAFGEARHQRSLTANDVDVRVDVYVAQLLLEWEEQKRVRKWQKMQLDNPNHPKAIQLRDEALLEPCMERERDGRLCPSIQIDFDRTRLLGTLAEEPTRDMGASLVCELVSPSPMIIGELLR